MYAYADIMISPPIADPVALGAAVRERRLKASRTQAQVAMASGVSRAWLIRLEDGHPRAELTRVLSVLHTLGLVVRFEERTITDRERAERDFLSDLLGSEDE